MKRAIGAVLYHCFEPNDHDSRHMFCEKEEGTWFKYQEAKKGKVIIMWKSSKSAFMEKPRITMRQ